MKRYSFVSIALIVVKLFQENNKFSSVLGLCLEFDSILEAPESRREHDCDFLPPTGSFCECILTQLLNYTDSRLKTIFDFLPPRQIQILVLKSF